MSDPTMPAAASPERITVRPGPHATAWLVERIRALQGPDPLRPVTVVAPTQHAGLHLRRRLAGAGYANARFTVLARLAETLGAARLAAAGLSPVTPVARAALVRAALRAAGGPLAPHADHAGLVDLVAALAAELRRRGDPERDRALVAASGTATSRAAATVTAEYERRRAALGMYDDVDLLDAAVEAVRGGDAATGLAEGGAVVAFLLPRLDPPEERFLAALAGAVTVIVAQAGLVSGETRFDGGLSVTALVAPDPVEEVRAAVRDAIAAAERADAVPLHATAIVYRDEETYGAPLREVLEASGAGYAALDGRPLVTSVAARGLLGLIGLCDRDMSRDAVLGWLSGVPHRGGLLRNQARWDQLSRDAGVVRGAAQWRDRLSALASARERALERLEVDPEEDEAAEARRAALRRDVEDARRIVEHIAAIDEATRAPAEQSWEAHVAWALRLRDEFLAPDAAWSAADVEASQAVEEVVRGLTTAHAVEPRVSVAVFLRALEDALGARRLPDGRLGRGVLVGPHRLLAGLDLRRVHILGAVEEAFPAPLPPDPLLPGDALDRRDDHEAREREQWLTALGSAAGGEVTLSCPLVDVEGRAVHPSPWLLDALTGDGRRPRASEVREGTFVHPALRRVRGAETSGSTPLSVAERREREAIAARAADRPVRGTPLARRDDLPLGRALEVLRARRSAALTEFDGNLAGAASLPLMSAGLAGERQSATGVETWATCPFRFLMGRILTVRPTEDVDDERWWQIDAAERGSLIHVILERFFAGVAATGRPLPGAAYDDADARRIESIAAEEFAAVEARGVAGHPLVWANERAAILADLRTLLRHDAEQRGAGGWEPEHLEQPFGMEGEESWPPVTVRLRDGRTVEMRGFIDRVDRSGGGRLRVLDYKTGRRPSGDVSPDSLLDGGRRLQLPVYGAAVRDRERALGRTPAPVTAAYWYATVRGSFHLSPLEVGDDVEDVLAEALSRVDAGVRAGCFPMVPGDFVEFRSRCENCTYCAYDTLCPSGRDVLAAAKESSAGVAPYRALHDPGESSA